ncbi:MAG: glycoside hydrolase family 15 protein, partial [Lapillicoccus sp.]
MSDTPIADHAFLSDGHTAALVTRDGSVDWLCLPRFDSPAVFGRLLDDAAGRFSIRPVDRDAVAERRYVPHSLVLETVWTCASGTLVVRDCLALDRHERGHDLGLGSPGVLLRHVVCRSGVVEVEVEWSPRPEYGLIHPRMSATRGGYLAQGGATVLLLSTDLSLRVASPAPTETSEGAVPPGTALGRTTLEEGDQLGLALEQAPTWTDRPTPWSARRVARAVDGTVAAWSSWSSMHQSYEGPWAELVHRSGLVLQGLTYAPSGAIVAAATTSLPEGVGTPRTWDYRYTWVRDASLTLRGLWVAACPDEAARFFAFFAQAASTQLERGLPLQIMFGVGGERDLSERELPHLAGWRDSRPVRVGNGAWTQRQQDVYGALLDAAYQLRDYLDDIDEPTRALLVAAVETAAESWREPDQGIWEIRGEARRHVHSALMCWIALDRGIAMADRLGAVDRTHRWREVRDAIGAAILTEGWNDRVGAFTQSFDGDSLDASTLLVVTSGLLPPEDPRVHATIDAVVANLCDERGLVLRYRGDDGLDGDEGSFLLCTFWLAEALAVTGRVDEAEAV